MERSVDGGPYVLTGLTPRHETSAEAPVRPDWLGKTVSYRVFEWMGGQRAYSNEAGLALPGSLEPPQNLMAHHDAGSAGAAVTLSWDRSPLARHYVVEMQQDGTWQEIGRTSEIFLEHRLQDGYTHDTASFRVYSQLGGVQSEPSLAVQHEVS